MAQTGAAETTRVWCALSLRSCLSSLLVLSVSLSNLASVALPMFVTNKVFDFKKLYEVTYVITKNLNKVIDINYYVRITHDSVASCCSSPFPSVLLPRTSFHAEAEVPLLNVRVTSHWRQRAPLTTSVHKLC